MHNLENDGFAVLTYDVVNNESSPVLLFSGSYRKCVEFIKTAKTITFRTGLVFCNSKEAKDYLASVGFFKKLDSMEGGES